MKVMFGIITGILIIFSGVLTSCSSGNKTHISKIPDRKVKTDTAGKTYVAGIRPDTLKKIEDKTSVSLPPSQIEHKFSGEHNLATNVIWTKEANDNTKESYVTNYKAVYVENDKKNWITYTDTGIIIEERHEIVTDQLPQNIYNSIKERYPDSKIVSASTYKHLKRDGSYVVTIMQPASNSKEKELIIRENGTFVE